MVTRGIRSLTAARSAPDKPASSPSRRRSRPPQHGRFDVVVVGSGINGLVAAAELSGAGLSVCLLEANDRIGGFVAGDATTFPGYVVDRFSSWHPQFVAGPAYEGLADDLRRHGLRYDNTDGVVTAAVDEGGVVCAHRSPEETAAALGTDGTAYLGELDIIARNAGIVGGVMGSEPTGRRLAAVGLSALRRHRDRNALARQAISSGRAWADRSFTGTMVDRLWAPWLLHAGLSPDAASGGIMAPLMAGTIHAAGLPVVHGGAGEFLNAFTALLTERGVVIRTGARAARIEPGRLRVLPAAGEPVEARTAVLASVSTQALYEDLLPRAPAGQRRAARPGRAAMQIHVTLDRPLRWSDERLAQVPLVHVGGGSDAIALSCAEARAGLLPARPTVAVGRQHLLDQSRAPAGAGLLWLQLQELPFHPKGDAAGHLDASGTWTGPLAEHFADRVIDRIEQFAPGLRSSITGRQIITPADLVRANLSCRDGDPYGGDCEPDQMLWWRSPSRQPVPGHLAHRRGDAPGTRTRRGLRASRGSGHPPADRPPQAGRWARLDRCVGGAGPVAFGERLVSGGPQRARHFPNDDADARGVGVDRLLDGDVHPVDEVSQRGSVAPLGQRDFDERHVFFSWESSSMRSSISLAQSMRACASRTWPSNTWALSRAERAC